MRVAMSCWGCQSTWSGPQGRLAARATDACLTAPAGSRTPVVAGPVARVKLGCAPQIQGPHFSEAMLFEIAYSYEVSGAPVCVSAHPAARALCILCATSRLC